MMCIMVHLVLLQRSHKLFVFVGFCFFFFSVRVFSTTLSSRLVIQLSASSHILLFPSSVFFIAVVLFFISDWLFLYFVSFLFFLSLCVSLTEFICFSLQFIKHPYNYCFELYVGWIACLHLILFSGFCSVLSFGTFVCVSSFWLTLCVCFYVLGRSATSPCLDRIALFGRCLAEPCGAISLVT